MDYKVRNLTIVIVLIVILSAFGIVLSLNSREPKTGNNDNQSSVSETTVAEQDYLAFLQDDSFFDKELSQEIVSSGKTDKKQLYMLATSVSHDIRIIITDDSGETVTGQSFNVVVDDDEYKDLDQDGIIRIPELTAGEYYVTLKPISDYQVPAEPMKVRVKDNLEYAVIDDISYYIYTEDQVNPQAEDTFSGIDSEDVDASENSSVNTSTGKAFGIDVSKWQKSIDWNKVKASGVQFVIIRCGYRGSSSGVLVEDPYFKENIEGAKAAGLEVGVYFFSQATSEMEAVEEASMCLSLVKDYDIDLPIYLDSESAGGRGRADGLDKSLRTAVTTAFCKTIESADYKAGVYASRNWLYNNLDANQLDGYSVWDAEYRSEPIYTGRFDMWQYTSSGMIDGITTKVDLNIRY